MLKYLCNVLLYLSSLQNEATKLALQHPMSYFGMLQMSEDVSQRIESTVNSENALLKSTNIGTPPSR
jgi:hypothetical protein